MKERKHWNYTKEMNKKKKIVMKRKKEESEMK